MQQMQPKYKPADKCLWTEDEEGIWHTGCGEAFFFDSGGPEDNHLRFCGYCGKRLVEVKGESK